MNTVIHFPADYNFGPVDAERLVYGFRASPCSVQHTFMSNGRCFECGATEPAPGDIRPDVVDAVLDSHMITRLIRDYGASKRDIANTFGASRLGKCAPCKVLVTSADWSAL